MSRTRAKAYLAVGVTSAVAVHLLGASLAWSGVVALVAPLVVVAAPRFLAATVIGAFTPGPRERHKAEDMSGTEFEEHVAHIARSCGVPVIMTPVTGDWGVDLIIGNRPNRVAVQCKRRSRPIGAGAVQEVVAGAPMHDCARTMVVTNHEFTAAARKLAELHGCELVGRAELTRLRSTIRRLTAPSNPPVS